MKNKISITHLTRLCVLCIVSGCLFVSCTNFEDKRDCLNRIFLEESGRQNYYTEKWLDAYKKADTKKMDIYLDSCKMANYCSHRAYNELRKNNR